MTTYKDMIHFMKKQFALDYNCQMEKFEKKDTLVTISKHIEGARKYKDAGNFLSMLSFRGKLVITADDLLQDWCKEVLAKNISAEWGFDIGSLLWINEKLKEFGYQIEMNFLRK